jgi:rubrerythrin
MALSREGTLEALLTTLIQAEATAQNLYLRLMEAFAHEPDAAQVWWKMGADEAAHIRLLEQVRDALSPEQLQSPADPLIVEKAQAVSGLSYERILSRIETLEDAYQETHNLENSEINAVFEFVLTEYFPKPLRVEFVHNMLREHIGRLDGLRTTEWRRSVLAQK